MASAGRLSPGFSPLSSETGLRIVDPIERRRFSLYTPDPVRPAPVSPEVIRFPVDAAVAITTRGIHLRELVNAFVHDSSDGLPVEVLPGSETTFEDGEYHVELNAPIKLYLLVTGAFAVEASATEIGFSFDGPSEVVVGARSYHERPAATITTTDRPEDVMAAVSYLGSALKTTSPERAYPTLRGHPPAIERGPELHVPDGLDRPDTDLRLELPPDYEFIFVAASLAYYLGAEVVPGDRPRLRTSSGFYHSLGDGGREFAAEVERVLKQTFLLDCLARTEGYYRVELAERSALEPLLDLDFRELYEDPLARRVERYLEVPFEPLAAHLPQWALTAHLPPWPESIEAIPFVANELAVVRTRPQRSSPRPRSGGGCSPTSSKPTTKPARRTRRAHRTRRSGPVPR